MEASHAGADAMVSLNSEVGPETSMVVPQPAAANCLNCDHQVTGKFCVNCAQRTDTHPMNWTWLMHEVQHGIFHVDRGILFTLKELFTRPGHAVRDYLEGKRKRYFPPFTLVMLLGALGILETNWLGVDSEGLDMEESIGSPELNREVFDAMMGHQTLFYLLMLPFMAFGTWLLFRKYGHGFVEHVVLNTFIAGQVAMISLVTWPLYRLGGPGQYHDHRCFALDTDPVLFTATFLAGWPSRTVRVPHRFTDDDVCWRSDPVAGRCLFWIHRCFRDPYRYLRMLPSVKRGSTA